MEAAQKMAEVEVGSLRHRALVTVQKFKSTWVEMGALLVEVRRSGEFSDWGFASFEEYCSKELRLKRATAEKLTASYSFLVRHEKQALEARPPERPAPAFEVVSVLAGAEERGQLQQDDYATIRQSLWEEDRSPAKLARELKERFPAPAPEPPPIDLRLRRLAAAARKLSRELGECGEVPSAVSERALALAEDVEALVK